MAQPSSKHVQTLSESPNPRLRDLSQIKLKPLFISIGDQDEKNVTRNKDGQPFFSD